MQLANRRYDIDWLRVIAIGLLLIYHIAIGFQPWGMFIGFIKNDESLTSVWVPLSMLNVWRIPLLFFVSGMGVYFAIQRRSWKQLLIERTRRILLPFIFGVLAIVPLHLLIWQQYYHQDLEYVVNPSHLWFLGNIFIYVLIGLPVFMYLKRHPEGKVFQFFHRVYRNPAGLLLIMVPFIIESTIIQPESFELYAMTLHGFVLGFIAFMTGFSVVYSGLSFWETVTKWRWILLIAAFAIYLTRVLLFNFRTPDFMMSIESCLWIFTVFGFGHKYLNKPGKALQYLSQAAYPIYIIHMVFLYAGSAYLFPLQLSPMVKFLLLNGLTFAGALGTYELVIRRISFLRPLFGLKGNATPKAPKKSTKVVLHNG